MCAVLAHVVQAVTSDPPRLQDNVRRHRKAIGASMPSNAGGAKGPDFWCAFEDGEVKVIGDEPDNA